MLTPKDTARRIGLRITALGITDADLCRRMGLNTGQVGRWIRGESMPSARQLGPLAAALECDPNYLLSWVPPLVMPPARNSHTEGRP
jgi:transcriptional regulator with XRE-family HTH domain